jgi:hypothetical protein
MVSALNLWPTDSPDDVEYFPRKKRPGIDAGEKLFLIL